MTEGTTAHPRSIRIRLTTGGTWRAEQVARTLLAIDRIATRVGVASSISETCEAYDYVVRHMATFGLQGKLPAEWHEPKSPTEAELRTDLGVFASSLRNAGVELKISQLGVSFRFLVDDLYDLLPVSSRAEVEHIKMSSPGSWSLMLMGAIKSEGAARLLEKIFDSIFYPDATRRRAQAEASQAEAQAAEAHAKARSVELQATKEAFELRERQCSMVLDYAVAVDSLSLSLRNAGFDHNQIQKVVRDAITADLDLLARHKSLGLIESLTMERIKVPQNADL